MNQYKVYQVEWGADSKGEPAPRLRPIMTLTAPTAEEALRIAKQKGVEFPIIGAHNGK